MLCSLLLFGTKTDDNSESGLGCSSVAEHPPGAQEALSSIPNTGKKEGGQGGRGKTDRKIDRH